MAWVPSGVRAVAGNTHAVGAMAQKKQYLHAPLEELAILIWNVQWQTVAKSVENWTRRLRTDKWWVTWPCW